MSRPQMNSNFSRSCGTRSNVPPPPPTNSTRYMISLSKEDLVNTFEFEFEPLIVNEKHPSRSIGVKIKSLLSSGKENTYNNVCTRNNVQVGDVLYRMDRLLVKTEYFDHIMNLLSLPLKNNPSSDTIHSNKKAIISLTFERNSSSSNQKLSNQKQVTVIEEENKMKTNSKKSNIKSHGSNKFNYVRRVSFDQKENTKLVNDNYGLQSTPSLVSISSSAFSSHDDSSKEQEEQVLHSIFSPTVTNNTAANDEIGTLIFSDYHNHSTISAGKNNLSFSVFSNGGVVSSSDSGSCENSKSTTNSASPSTPRVRINETTANGCSSSKFESLRPFEMENRIHTTKDETSYHNISTNIQSRKSIVFNSSDENFSFMSPQEKSVDLKTLETQKLETRIGSTRKNKEKFFSPEFCYSSTSSADETADDLISPLGVNIVIESRNNSTYINESQNDVVQAKDLTAPIFRVNEGQHLKSNNNGNTCGNKIMTHNLNDSQQSLQLRRASKLSSNSTISTYTFQDENKENIYFQTPYKGSSISQGSRDVGMSCSLSSVYHSPKLEVSHSNSTMSGGDESKHVNQLDMSTRSWHKMPVEKLTCNYVNQCEDELELVKISNALSLTTPSKYPSLLRMTNLRLDSIRNKKLSGTIHNQTKNDQENNLTNIHSTNHEDSKYINVDVEKNGHYNCYDNDSKNDFNSALSQHAHIANGLEQVLKDRDNMHSKLSTEVKDLKTKLEDSQKELLKQQSIHFQKITDLETIKDNLEQDVMILDEMVVSSSAQAREVTNEMKLKNAEIEKLQEALRGEETKRIQGISESENAKKKLNQRIEDLSKQLVFQVKETNEARSKAVKELRKEFEAKSREDKSKISHLTRKLAETHINLDSVQKRNDSLSMNVKSLAEQLQKSLKLDDVMKQVKQAETATILITRALEESEKELELTKEINDLSEQRINELKTQNTKLESENKTLCDKISKLTNELQKSHLTIGKLTREIDTKSYARKEVENKNSFERKSLELKRNLNENNDQKKSNRSITRIQTPGKFNILEQPVTESKIAMARRVTPSARATPKCDEDANAKNNNPRLNNNKENVNSKAKDETFSKRAATVRAFGGRAALQARINKSRMVTLKNENEKSKVKVPPSTRIPFHRHDLNQQSTNTSSFIQRQGSGKENLRQ